MVENSIWKTIIILTSQIDIIHMVVYEFKIIPIIQIIIPVNLIQVISSLKKNIEIPIIMIRLTIPKNS